MTRYLVTPQRNEVQLRDELVTRFARHYAEKTSLVFRQYKLRGKLVEWTAAPRYVSVGLRLHNAKHLRRAMGLTPEIGHAAGIGDGSAEPPINALLMGELLVYQFVLPEYIKVGPRKIKLWQTITVDDPHLEGAVGFGLHGVPVEFAFTDEAPHALVCGVSGSGKTELIKTIIYQQMLSDSPELLRFGIVDPKVDYSRFADSQHLLWKPANDAAEVKALIKQFHDEFNRRITHTLRDEPRWVLVIDEADQSAVLQDPENHERVKDIVLRGRSVKVNLIVGTHKPNANSIGEIAGGLSNRWLGMMSNARDSGTVEGGLALHKLAGKGDFYTVVGNNKFRFQAAVVQPKHYNLLPTATVSNILTAEPIAESITIPKPKNRPNLQVDAKSVAYYYYKGFNEVSISEARKQLRLTRTAHYLNKGFAEQLTLEVKRLEELDK